MRGMVYWFIQAYFTESDFSVFIWVCPRLFESWGSCITMGLWHGV